MNEEVSLTGTTEPGARRTRPVILTVVCLVAFTGSGLLSVLFLAGFLNAGWIAAVSSRYMAESDFTKTQVLALFGAGFILHGMIVAGNYLIWRLRKTGYYLAGLSCLAIAVYQLMNPSASLVPAGVYFAATLLYALFFYFLHRS